MAGIRLERLPDRTPVKIAIVVPPELNRALLEYAEAYQAAYGVAEPLSELIPAMLASFIESDRTFARERRAKGR